MSTKPRQRDKHHVRRLEQRRLLLKQRRDERRAQSSAMASTQVASTTQAPLRGHWLLGWLPRSWRAALEWLLRERRREMARIDAIDEKAGPRAW